MDRCFTFQWGDLFSDGGASFLGGGIPHWGGIGFDGRRVQKNHRDGAGRVGRCPPCPFTMGNPDHTSFKLNIVSFLKSLPTDLPLN